MSSVPLCTHPHLSWRACPWRDICHGVCAAGSQPAARPVGLTSVCLRASFLPSQGPTAWSVFQSGGERGQGKQRSF